MLFSPSRRVAFAHYPKTAGSSVTAWFLRAFPDAMPVCQGCPHTTVARGLDLLTARTSPSRQPHWLLKMPLVSRSPGAREAEPVRIIGVIREPFEMLVSLYEYWRRSPGIGGHAFIRTAQRGSFADFLAIGFRRRKILAYEDFFDVGGPMWPQTRLVAFDSLEAGLEEVCREFDISTLPRLGKVNASSGRKRPLVEYAAEAGPLYDRVRAHFSWYYERSIFLTAGSSERRITALPSAA